MLPSHDAAVFLHFGFGERQQLALERAHRRHARMAALGRHAAAIDYDGHAKAGAGRNHGLRPRCRYAVEQLELALRQVRDGGAERDEIVHQCHLRHAGGCRHVVVLEDDRRVRELRLAVQHGPGERKAAGGGRGSGKRVQGGVQQLFGGCELRRVQFRQTAPLAVRIQCEARAGAADVADEDHGACVSPWLPRDCNESVTRFAARSLAVVSTGAPYTLAGTKTAWNMECLDEWLALEL